VQKQDVYPDLAEQAGQSLKASRAAIEAHNRQIQHPEEIAQQTH
jgi:hypothetical protein